MSKAQKSTQGSKAGNGLNRKYVERDLKTVNPLKEQFEPTKADPIKQHHKMAGM